MKFKESKSIYLQIADRINDEILQGQYAEEGRIPSVREYAATVEVNANTVVRTYDYLQGQEIIHKIINAVSVILYRQGLKTGLSLCVSTKEISGDDSRLLADYKPVLGRNHSGR